jgi:hypothetical protein
VENNQKQNKTKGRYSKRTYVFRILNKYNKSAALKKKVCINVNVTGVQKLARLTIGCDLEDACRHLTHIT